MENQENQESQEKQPNIQDQANSLLKKIMTKDEWTDKEKKELKKTLLTLSRVIDML